MGKDKRIGHGHTRHNTVAAQAQGAATAKQWENNDMLKKLTIKNFTLIDQLEMNFHPGFSVITGETGAGKSIIIGAIGLLLGNRADAKQVKSGKTKCIIEAIFDLSIYNSEPLDSFFKLHDLDFTPEECIIRREINANGKSRAFINDTPVTLAVMRDLGEQLIDVHSQHQNLLLNKEDFQMNVVDIIARNKAQLSDYRSCYASFKQAEKELSDLRLSIAKNRENEDFLRFQQKELSEANLKDNEQEELEQESDIMSHAEDIKRALHEADFELDNEDTGIVGRIRNIAGLLHGIEGIYPNSKEFAERIDNCFIEIKDIAQEIYGEMESVEFDPQRLNDITSRLDTIYSLEQKYHASAISELLSKLDDINTQLEGIDNGDEMLQEQERRVAELRSQCEAKATVLTASRKEAAVEVENEISRLLIPLGIPKVRFKVKLSASELGANGADKITFLFSANSSTDMRPVAEVASGGEIARVMLSLKAMISKAIGLPTIIFDEIDTGVSGRVAEQMAVIMKDMGQTHRQVICITHLPQIAAAGSTHYKVAKQETQTGTVSIVKELDNAERIDEIAQMLSGANITQAAIENAMSLLKSSK